MKELCRKVGACGWIAHRFGAAGMAAQTAIVT